MNLHPPFRRAIGFMLAVALGSSVLSILPAAAGTTGQISGTVTDSASGAAVANVKVAAVSPTDRQTTTTNAKGFFVLQNLSPDEYTLTAEADGYANASVPGVAVFQDETSTENLKLAKALSTIATVKSRSGGSLVKADVTSDSYTVSGAQLDALSGGNDTHKTLYRRRALRGCRDGRKAEGTYEGNQSENRVV